MIYLKDKKVCILEKPKCASTSLSKAIFFAYKGKSNLFRSNKAIASVNFNYSNPQYIHCNLEGAIKKVKEISGSTEGVTFISTIRNPQSLVNSMYYFGLNNKNLITNILRLRK